MPIHSCQGGQHEEAVGVPAYFSMHCLPQCTLFLNFAKQSPFSNETMNLQKLKYVLHSGKQPKFLYYAKAYVKTHVPRFMLRPRVSRLDDIVECRPDLDYIARRVHYYAKASIYPDTSEEAWMQASYSIADTPRPRQKVYWLDTMEFARHFPQHLRWHLEAGDVDYVPSVPSIVKSRPICADNHNSVLMKLDKVRHFTFINDKMPWRQKADRVIFRGKVAGKQPRLHFMEQYYGHPRVDAGAIDCIRPEWVRPKMSLYGHLPFRYIMCIEGNDVASNLKWVMSSNSIAVMPRPTCETWFMEGMLVPGFHYIEVRPDFSDLIERLDYYSAHPDEAEAIVRHAHEWVEQFFDERRERLISLLVLRRYFRGVDSIGKE